MRQQQIQVPKLKKGNIFLCSITHNGQIDQRMAAMFFSHASQERAILHRLQQTSLLASACNNLWADALNRRTQENLKWFVMVHADVVPEPMFADKLIAIAEKYDADLVSAVIPIKDDNGLTSTAISGPDHFTRYTRLTTKQVNHPFFPETFDAVMACDALFNRLPDELKIPKSQPVYLSSNLLVNTGCMVARLDREWCAHSFFTINDRIIVQPGGRFAAEVEPEDWFFSRTVAELGGKVMATRTVRVEHLGGIPYRSDRAWGKNVDPATL